MDPAALLQTKAKLFIRGLYAQRLEQDPLAMMRAELERLNARKFALIEGKTPLVRTTLDQVLASYMKAEDQHASVLNKRHAARAMGPADASATDRLKRVARETQLGLESEALRMAQERTLLDGLRKQMDGYRLVGVSCFSVGGRPNELGFRIDPSYKGVYGKREYVILSSSLKLFRHTLPHFIPVDALDQDYLPHNPGGFIRRIAQYLSVYVGRKLEVDRLRQSLAGKAHVDASEACDVVTVTGRLAGRRGQVYDTVEFKFAALLNATPEIATLTALARGRQERRDFRFSPDAGGGLVEHLSDAVNAHADDDNV